MISFLSKSSINRRHSMKTPKPATQAMKILNFLFTFLLYFCIPPSKAQPSTQGYSCNPNRTTSGYPCNTYAYYRVTPPSLLSIASVGDLFSVSQLMISEPSNISSPTSPLLPNQPLLVPISCGCNFVRNLSLSISYSNLTYRIQSDDTFWLVSTMYYGNLTTYQSVEAVNPTLVPTDLSTGQDVIFPIFCKCPDRSQMRKGVKWLISYVVQPSDDLGSIATRFGTSKEQIVGVNGNKVQPSSTVFVTVSRLPKLNQPVGVASGPSGTGIGREDDYKGDVMGLGVGLGVCVVLLGLVIGLWGYRERLFRKRFEEQKPNTKGKSTDVGMGVEGKKSWKEADASLLAEVSESLDKYKVFEIEDLKDVTDGFDDKFLIEGSVFKACIEGQVFAIKKMGWNAYEELKILQMVNHGSLVKLVGFCIDPEDCSCFLVYDYVENGSLNSWLRDNNKKETLTWKTRLRIATDVANGLQYIHEHTRPQVVHKDIKSSNILLDSNMRAKIANFGLAKSGCNAITMHIVGTQGYMAPEYLSGGVVSTKMDVFSFGVVLLELVSGKEAIDDEGKVLWASVQGLVDGTEAEEKAKRVSEWMDETMLKDSSCLMESVMSVLALAVACVRKDPLKRPSMMEIVYVLSKGEDLFSAGLSGDGFVPLVVAR